MGGKVLNSVMWQHWRASIVAAVWAAVVPNYSLFEIGSQRTSTLIYVECFPHTRNNINQSKPVRLTLPFLTYYVLIFAFMYVRESYMVFMDLHMHEMI